MEKEIIEKVIDEVYDYILTTFYGFTDDRRKSAEGNMHAYINDYIRENYPSLTLDDINEIADQVEFLYFQED